MSEKIMPEGEQIESIIEKVMFAHHDDISMMDDTNIHEAADAILAYIKKQDEEKEKNDRKEKCKYSSISHGIGIDGTVQEVRITCELNPDVDYLIKKGGE
jgi:hypothetical protein